MAKQYKLRRLVHSNSQEDIYGVTIPQDIVPFFKETYFSIKMSGNNIVMTSGALIEIKKEDIDNFDLKSLKI